MLSSKMKANTFETFVSAKTSCAVPVRHEALRDALILATLDPAVRSICHIATVPVGNATVDVDAVVICRDDGFRSLDIVPARIVRSADERKLVEAALETFALRPETLTAHDLAQQPRLGNARTIWKYRGAWVGIGLRLRVLQALDENGPMTLASLLETVAGEGDPAPGVMAMAWSDLIEIDIASEPIGPRTLVRSRS